jgi:hypothetical protein
MSNLDDTLEFYFYLRDFFKDRFKQTQGSSEPKNLEI